MRGGPTALPGAPRRPRPRGHPRADAAAGEQAGRRQPGTTGEDGAPGGHSTSGLRIAVRYRPAAREAQVGGDWYDAFAGPDGATTVVVGDVTGHDRTAAAVMGQLRNMLRGIAHALDGDPAAVLTTLDRAVADLGVGTLATAVLARIERPADGGADEGLVFRWSDAGHPPPLVIEPDGDVRLLERPSDVLLGVAPGRPRQAHRHPLAPGSTVVLYTDGLVERRGANLDDGLDALTEAARDLHGTPVAGVCDALLTRIAPDFSDDVALLAVRVGGDQDEG